MYMYIFLLFLLPLALFVICVLVLLRSYCCCLALTVVLSLICVFKLLLFGFQKKKKILLFVFWCFLNLFVVKRFLFAFPQINIIVAERFLLFFKSYCKAYIFVVFKVSVVCDTFVVVCEIVVYMTNCRLRMTFLSIFRRCSCRDLRDIV